MHRLALGLSVVLAIVALARGSASPLYGRTAASLTGQELAIQVGQQGTATQCPLVNNFIKDTQKCTATGKTCSPVLGKKGTKIELKELGITWTLKHRGVVGCADPAIDRQACQPVDDLAAQDPNTQARVVQTNPDCPKFKECNCVLGILVPTGKVGQRKFISSGDGNQWLGKILGIACGIDDTSCLSNQVCNQEKFHGTKNCGN